MSDTVYVTAQGDTWDLISYRLFGTEHKVAALIEANQQHRKLQLFPSGIRLRIPAAVVSSGKDTSQRLPPWKR